MPPHSNLNSPEIQADIPAVSGILKAAVMSGLCIALCLHLCSLPGNAQGAFDNEDPILRQAREALQKGQGNSARAIYEAYVKESPGSCEAYLGLAKIAQRRFDYPGARQYLEQALGSSPENAEVVAEMGRLYHLWSTTPFGTPENYQGRADEHFKHAEELAPDSPLVLTYRGEWFLDENDLVSAERNFQQALKFNPRFVPAYQGLTRYYIRVGDLQRAKDTALHAVELEPDNSISFFQMAQLLALAEHPEKALQYAMKSEQLDFGRDPRRDLFIAAQLEKLGSVTQAIDYYARVAEDFPNHAPTLLKLAQLHEQQADMDKSAAYYRQAIAKDPRILQGMLTEARNNLRLENTVMAAKQYIRLLTISRDQAIQKEALHGIASAFYLDHFYGRTDTAMVAQVADTFARQAANDTDPVIGLDIIKLDIARERAIPAPARSRLNSLAASEDDLVAGEALFLLGEYAKAKERLDAVDGVTARGYLEVGDRLLLDHALLSAQAMYQRGYQIEALPELKQGLDRIDAKRTLTEQRLQEGNTLFNAKDYSGALVKYQEAQKLFPEWETPYMRLGDTYEQLKETADAYRTYKRAVELNPTLLDSKGFAKKYQKLEKKASK